MKKLTDTTLAITADYRRFVEELKARVSTARLSAARRINHEMIVLYWDIGRGIVEKQKALGWGESVVEMVAGDLRAEFPDMRGFSAQNVWRMKQFYIAHSSDEFLSQLVRELKRMPKSRASDFLRQPVAELGGVEVQAHPAPEFLSQAVRELVAAAPWGHHANVLAKLSDPAARLWYLRATARFGWSRNVLLNQIKAVAYERAVTPSTSPSRRMKCSRVPPISRFSAGPAPELQGPEGRPKLAGGGAQRNPRTSPPIRSSPDRGFRNIRGSSDARASVAPAGVHTDFWIASGGSARSSLHPRLISLTPRGAALMSAPKPTPSPTGVAACALQSKLPGELKGKLPTAKQLADIVRAEMEGGK